MTTRRAFLAAGGVGLGGLLTTVPSPAASSSVGSRLDRSPVPTTMS